MVGWTFDAHVYVLLNETHSESPTPETYVCTGFEILGFLSKSFSDKNLIIMQACRFKSTTNR